MVVIDIEAAARPGEPGAASGQIPLRGDRALRTRLGQVARQSVVGERQAVPALARSGQAAERVIGEGDVDL